MRPHVDDMTHRFYSGQLQTDQATRLQQSFDDLAVSEKNTIKISDFLIENYQKFPITYAMAHPTPRVIAEIFFRLVAQMGIADQFDRNLDQYSMGRLALPVGNRAFTPYDVETLGLKYAFDIDWLVNAKNLMIMLEKAMKRAAVDA